MEIETSPEQPDEVARAILDEVAAREPAPDPWWQAGVDETLGQ